MRARYFRLCLAALLFAFFYTGCATDSEPDVIPDVPEPVVHQPVTNRDASAPNAVLLFYGTDRKYTGSKNVEKMFSNKKTIVFDYAKDFSYGYALVSIPLENQIPTLKSPAVYKMTFEDEPKKKVKLQKVTRLKKSSFFSNLSNAINKTPEKKAFVFVHGYNISFAEAAMRTAQLAYDLNYLGKPIVPVLYSWPSRNKTALYFVDEETVEISAIRFKLFLEEIVRNTKANTIYLIGHSMGNVALAKAFASLMNGGSNIDTSVFRELIMAAPDINREIFKHDIAPRITNKTAHITLYASSHDKALKMAKVFHGYRRAGDTKKGILVLDGIDTIDASKVPTNFLGHAYFVHSQAILADMGHIIATGAGAEDRSACKPTPLKKVKTDQGSRYWKIKKKRPPLSQLKCRG